MPPLLVYPLFYLPMRYMWLRLCRDPFLSQSDTMLSIWCEALRRGPPSCGKLKRVAPTILYSLLFLGCALGSKMGRSMGDNTAEPNLLLILFYNGFGTLLILLCAVWLVDILCLVYLFLFVNRMQGKMDAAQNWWYDKSALGVFSPQYTSLETGEVCNSETENGDDNRSARSEQLNEERRRAKLRAGIIICFYSWWTIWAAYASFHPHTLELNVPVPRLPPQCDGYRLVMASDLHAGSMSGAKDTKWMVDHINDAAPDAIAFVGDVGDQPVNDYLREKLEPLNNLNAEDGIFITFGNHENMNRIEDYRKLLRTESPFKDTLTVMENEHIIVNSNRRDYCSFAIVGMADWSGLRHQRQGQVAPDLDLALRSTPGPNGTTIKTTDRLSMTSLPTIMMQHQPKNMTEMAEAGVGLQLSGHTHGGQLWPQHIFLLDYDAISGLHAFGDEGNPSYLFVSEGIVGWGPRLRFLSKTDFAILTLRNSEIMKREGLLADTHLTVATFAMYSAVMLVPVSLLACLVPLCCRTKSRCQKYFRRGDQQGIRTTTSTLHPDAELA